MAAPDFSKAVVDLRKLTDYLLAPGHPDGAAKAAFFAVCGFSADRPAALAQALREQAADATPTSVQTDFGVKLIVDAPLPCADGRVRRIRTVWIMEDALDRLRFVTAYPLEARRGAR